MSAQRAYELGLVNQVVPSCELDDTVDEWIGDILRCAPLAIRAVKEASMRGLDMTLADAFNTSYEEEIARRNSEDAIEGPKAFSEKRTPNWQGK